MTHYPKVHIEIVRKTEAPSPVPFDDMPLGFGIIATPSCDAGHLALLVPPVAGIPLLIDLTDGSHQEQDGEGGAWCDSATISMLQPGDAIVIVLPEVD